MKKKTGAKGAPKIQGGKGNKILAHGQHPFAAGVFKVKPKKKK